jgi:lipopolysaccharide transport system ATP-binding protein
MYVRLAFAVAAHLEPEVLLVDEVLSVGDVQFQAKCLERARELQARGVALVLASHDEEQVRRFCERVVWLVGGRVRAEGRPDEVYAAYRGALLAETAERAGGSPAAPRHARPHLRLGENRFGTLEVEIAEVRIAHEREGRSARVRVDVDLDPRVEVRQPIVAVALHRLADGRKILDVNTQGDGVTLEKLAGPTRVALCLEPLDLEPGAYRVDVGVYEARWSYVYDYHWQAYELEVHADRDAPGPPRRWIVEH